MNKNILNKRITGFTLIELLVVISIISLVSSIVITSLAQAREDAKASQAKQELQQIRNAYELYVSNNNNQGPSGWPIADCQGEHDTNSDVPNGEYVDVFATDLEPYISEISLDPWGNRYYIDAIYNCDPSSGTDPEKFPEGCSGQTEGEWIYALGSAGPSGVPPVGNIPADWEADTGYQPDDIILMICDHES